MDIEKARKRFDGAQHVALPMPIELERLGANDIVDLDVRDDLRSGKEPFDRIMAAQQGVPAGGVLRLRATFEPVPLYRVLERFGFSNWTRKLADDDWEVWFYRGTLAVAEIPVPSAGATVTAEAADAITLDVRGLEPPQPMVLTLEALEKLAPGASLVQINSRIPRFLLPLLEERGFEYVVLSEEPDAVKGLIRRINKEKTEVTEKELTPELDVRIIPPREKHPSIFQTFDAMAVGAAFILVNDHDPFPLRYQFAAERKDQFSWDYLEQGPAVWRVRIGKTSA